MKNLIKNLLTPIFLVISLTCFAGTIDPQVPDNKYIEYADAFKYIYRICGTYNDDKLFCASAVAIDPHFILTAAHVVKNSKECSISRGDKKYKVTDIVTHKDFESNKFGHADIAIGYIEEDLGLDFYPSLYEDTDEASKVCSISGFGLTGSFITGAIKSDKQQRAGSNVIEYIDRDLLICDVTSKRRTELEFLIACGDSGGGLFIGNKLAGINSCVLAEDKKTDSNYGDESGHTRISKFVPWIKAIIAKKKKKSPF